MRIYLADHEIRAAVACIRTVVNGTYGSQIASDLGKRVLTGIANRLNAALPSNLNGATRLEDEVLRGAPKPSLAGGACLEANRAGVK